MAKAKRQREEACYICGHFHDYEGGEKCATCGHVLHGDQCATAAPDVDAKPTQILPGFLYVGSYDHASRLELLKAMGIGHILSLVPSCQELYKNTLAYHTVKSSPPDWQECFVYIGASHPHPHLNMPLIGRSSSVGERYGPAAADSVREKQERVVVHCMTGVTKSPAVVVAYLIRLRGWPLAESFTWVKDRHPTMELSRADVERLKQLEPHLLEQHSQTEAARRRQQAEAARAGNGASPAWRRQPQPQLRPQPLGWPGAQLQLQPQAGPPAFAFMQGSSQPPGAFVFGAGSRHPPPGSGAASMDT